MKPLTPLFLLLILLSGCSEQKTSIFQASDPALQWQGRIWKDTLGHPWLFGSAAYLHFRFQGDECAIWLRNRAPGDNYNYISLEIDGHHLPRMKIDFDTLSPVPCKPIVAGAFHDVILYKETEPVNGAIEISHLETSGLVPLAQPPQKKIEFIGNSITAGMSADATQIPCDQGKWYDQHNAYAAFGPVAARHLHCDYLVAAYSGLGMYRNWRTDHPVMKDIYESIALDLDPESPAWDYSRYKPDVVVLCVGSNDLSTGDGATPRLPFDSTTFITAYISFLKNIHQHHPQAKFLLLNGPVNSPADDELFRSCLAQIKKVAEQTWDDAPRIKLYFFDLIQPRGCGGHPDVAQQAEMAKAIEPVLQELLSL